MGILRRLSTGTYVRRGRRLRTQSKVQMGPSDSGDIPILSRLLTVELQASVKGTGLEAWAESGARNSASPQGRTTRLDEPGGDDSDVLRVTSPHDPAPQ